MIRFTFFENKNQFVGDNIVKKDLTEIVCIIDKSGSMWPLKDDVIGGFNNFLEEQKKVKGKAKITTTVFDTTYEILYNGKSLNEVEPLNEDTYAPSGMTALLDAVGRTVDEVGKRLKDTEEDKRPEKVIVVIMTDGEENSSKEYERKQIKEKIEHQQDKYKWEFVFLGANIDAFAEANSFGISAINTQQFAATGDGIKDTYCCMSNAVRSYREDDKPVLNPDD